MYVAEFAKKFRLIQRAAERAGYRLVDKAIALQIFGSGSFDAAKVRWSLCKQGRRPFNREYVPALFDEIDRQVPELLSGVPATALLLSADQLERIFRAKCLLEPDADQSPLWELLSSIETPEDVVAFLRQQDHSIGWSQNFKDAFDLVPAHQERLIHLFYKAVELSAGVRGRGRVLTLAAGTLTYVSEAFKDQPELGKFGAELEHRIDALAPPMVLMAEPLSYIATLHGRHGAFKRNIERMIEDPLWRRADFRERLHYCAVVADKPLPTALARRVAVGRNIARHLDTRRHLYQILCHDVGRVIEVYPTLVRYRRYRHLADRIKHGTLERLAAADISKALRARAEDQMEGRM